MMSNILSIKNIWDNLFANIVMYLSLDPVSNFMISNADFIDDQNLSTWLS